MRLRNLLFVAFGILACLNAWSADYSGTLPVMFINTANNAPIVNKTDYITATYYIDNLGLDGYQSVGSATDQLGLQIRGRGNYSWTGFDKKPYRIKLDKKADLLGLSSNRHFALLAHADDNYGFLRNPMGFWLSKALGMPWTPSEQPVEVVLNGDYIGLYFLTETIRVDKDRVNIVEQPNLATDPQEITGGWLVEIDNYRNDPHIEIKEGDGADIVITYKSPEELSAEQEAYLTDQMTTINSDVYATDKEVCQWGALVDIPTLARYYIVQEIMDDYESFHGSCYINKQQGEDTKWMFGPVWDFGSAFNYSKSQYVYQGREHHQTWIGEMCKFPTFMDEVKALWVNFYETQYYDMLDYAQQYADRIALAAKADAKRWPQYGNADEQERCDVVKKRLRTACSWLASKWGGTAQDPDLAPITIYYINSATSPWDEAYAYSWDESPAGFYTLFGNWPGSKMQPMIYNGQPAFVITGYPTQEMSDHPGLVINNGNSGSGNQTQDLPLINGAVYKSDGSYSEINDIVADGIKISPCSGGVILSADTPMVAQIARIDGTVQTCRVNAAPAFVPLATGIYFIDGRKIAIQ